VVDLEDALGRHDIALGMLAMSVLPGEMVRYQSVAPYDVVDGFCSRPRTSS